MSLDNVLDQILKKLFFFWLQRLNFFGRVLRMT